MRYMLHLFGHPLADRWTRKVILQVRPGTRRASPLVRARRDY